MVMVSQRLDVIRRLFRVMVLLMSIVVLYFPEPSEDWEFNQLPGGLDIFDTD